MSERLYGLYNDELAFIREEVIEYSGRFSKVASRLKLAAESVEDPHVSRLIDSVALLNARLRLKMEDEFPEICQSMLSALYPQYVAPIPSMAICRLRLDMAGSDLIEGFQIKRGSIVESEEIDGQICTYRTCSDTKLYPIEISNCRYAVPPFSFPASPDWSEDVSSAIQIDIRALSEKFPWEKTRIDRLELYLSGATAGANKIFEALMRDTLGIGIFSTKVPKGIFIGRECIEQNGFSSDQRILDHDARTVAAYQLLWEFFALPEKFRFLGVNLAKVWGQVAAPGLKIVFYLRRAHPAIQRSITDGSIQLGCTPVVNLFEQEAEPIQMTETQVQYRVVPSYRIVKGMEVHSIESVVATRSDDDGELEFAPFHLPNHHPLKRDHGRYWHPTRRRRTAGDDSSDRGTEVYLTIVDLNGRPRPADEWTMHVKTLCCNRDTVSKLGIQSKLFFNGGPVRADFQTSPTPTRRPVDNDDWTWRLVSHLSMNHLAVSEDSKGELLKEMLRLYTGDDQEVLNKAIDSITAVSYQRSTARLPGVLNGPGICRGLDINLEVDEERLEGIGAYLFFTVLDRFFSSLATINSFTRLTVRSKESQTTYYVGRARCGSKHLM